MSAPASAMAPAEDVPMTHRQKIEALIGLLLGMFVAFLSSTVVSNALPTITAAATSPRPARPPCPRPPRRSRG